MIPVSHRRNAQLLQRIFKSAARSLATSSAASATCVLRIRCQKEILFLVSVTNISAWGLPLQFSVLVLTDSTVVNQCPVTSLSHVHVANRPFS
jgi:hypothetical protein